MIQKKPGCVRRAIHLSQTSLIFVNPWRFHLNRITRSTSSSNQPRRPGLRSKSQEKVWQGMNDNVYWFLSLDAVKRTREGQDSTILQSDSIIWLLATCSSRTTIQCDHHTLIKSMSAEKPARLQWFTLIIDWSLNSLRFHPSSPASCFWFSVRVW